MRGIKCAILFRNGEVVDEDTEPDMDAGFLSANIFYLIDFIRNMNRDVRTVSIAGNNRFFIFVQDTLVLGVAASPDVNVPLLNAVGKHILESREGIESFSSS